MSEPVARQRNRELDDIKRILRSHLPALQERYKVRWLGIFGSYVRGEQGPDSDLDVLVEFEETPGLLDYVALQNELSDLLEMKVDLVMRSALKPRIGQRIEQEVVAV